MLSAINTEDAGALMTLIFLVDSYNNYPRNYLCMSFVSYTTYPYIPYTYDYISVLRYVLYVL